jgi:hypothetical protein
METILSIQIKTTIYCHEVFYSLYINDEIHKNYNTYADAKKGLLKFLQKVTKH